MRVLAWKKPARGVRARDDRALDCLFADSPLLDDLLGYGRPG
jgi:hypothetical protein